MSEAVAALPAEAPPRSRKTMLLALAALLLGGGGFASTYLGIWSPGAFLGKGGDHPIAEAEVAPVVFVDVPQIRLNIPGSRGRELVLSVSIETDSAQRAGIEHLMPRVLDAFTGFLAGIDHDAYDKRGVLEIIRAELVTRSRFVLGEAPVKDLLITEFLIQ